MKEKKYKCEKCGSESVNTPGTCCGGERKEVCAMCNSVHKDSTQSCQPEIKMAETKQN